MPVDEPVGRGVVAEPDGRGVVLGPTKRGPDDVAIASLALTCTPLRLPRDVVDPLRSGPSGRGRVGAACVVATEGGGGASRGGPIR